MQWIVPLANETSLWSLPDMSIDAGGLKAVALRALSSLENGVPETWVPVTKEMKRSWSSNRAKKHAATGVRSYHVAGGSGICFSHSHIQEYYFLGLAF